TAELIGQGQPTVLTVWATWCRPCQMELDHFKSYHDRWTNELGAQVVAISVDQPHQVRRIQPMARQKQWPYEILLDSNRNLQSLLGFTNIPQLYVINGEGQIVASYSGYDNKRANQVDRQLERLARSR
ncbi:MAG: TlpA disulfide reductase family protein, partial [Bacteroidota bacterium]